MKQGNTNIKTSALFILKLKIPLKYCQLTNNNI